MDKSKIMEYMQKYEKRVTPFGDQFEFKLGICYIRLGEYEKAQIMFERSILSMFAPPMFWKKSAQPHWLVDIFILSKRQDLLEDVIRELDIYRSGRLGNSLVACYSYAVADLLSLTSKNISREINCLTKNPKIKMTFAWGSALQGVIGKDQVSFDLALENVLAVHKGQATHGGLRETPEGWLCMPAMTLIYLAMRQNLLINIINEYVDARYIKYLYG
jgi:hypothetical protein